MSFRLGVMGVVGIAVGCSPVTADAPPSGSDGVTGHQLPCEISTVFQSKCGECHGPVPGGGVPMSLTSWDDLHSTSLTPGHEGKKIFQRVGERIHDDFNPMPPRIKPQLTEYEVALLDSWVGAGGPPGMACGSTDGSGGASNNNGAGGAPWGGGNGGSPPGGGGSPNYNTGGTPVILEDGGILEPDPDDIPVEPDPSECTWVDIKARADASGTPYTVNAGANEQYRCFGFSLPEFTATKTQALAFYTINEVEDAPWVHHWLLYQSATPQTNGQSADCLGTHLDAALVAGWAPGATPWFLPKHVGIELGQHFILEIHYNNPGGGPKPDSSGVRMCTTTDLRPQTASVSWLGTDFFPAVAPGAKGHLTKARCTPQISQPIHILRTWPHMHMLGRRMVAKMIRAGGATITYHDQPFDFNYQIQYDTPIIMNPGDSIETTCVYDNPTSNWVGFGQATTQEMCYNFTVAYPASALRNNLPSVHTNSCLNEPVP